jgi:hypothetical protein
VSANEAIAQCLACCKGIAYALASLKFSTSTKRDLVELPGDVIDVIRMAVIAGLV